MTRIITTLGLMAFVLGTCSFGVVIADLCPNKGNSCASGIAAPCLDTAGQCSAIADGNTPPGGIVCTDNTDATYWKATRVNNWTGCIQPTGTTTTCTQQPGTCETVMLYKSQALCNMNTTCNTDPDSECQAAGDAVQCP